ncbi:MAG: hypothetical protein ACK5KO_03220 [Arachnia sp.]
MSSAPWTQDVTYIYRTSVGNLLASVFMGGVFAFGGVIGFSSPYGWTYRGIDIDPTVVTVASLVLVGVAVLAVGLAIAGRIAGRREVAISPTRMLLPKGDRSRGMISVNPRDVTNLSYASQGRATTGMTIHYNGEKATLNRALFESAESFDHCIATVQQAVELAQSQGPQQPYGGQHQGWQA